MSWPAVTPSTPAPPFIAYRPGAWYGVDAGAIVIGAAVVADTAYGFPIFLERATTIGRIAMLTGTTVAGVTGQLALYASRADVPAPGRLIEGSLTNYDMGTSAGTVHELVFAAPIRLPRGFVWGVSRFNGAAQPRTMAVGTAAGVSGVPGQLLLGAAGAGAVHGSGPAVTVARVTGVAPYAAAWPTDFGTPTFGTNAPGSPSIAWRPD